MLTLMSAISYPYHIGIDYLQLLQLPRVLGLERQHTVRLDLWVYLPHIGMGPLSSDIIEQIFFDNIPSKLFQPFDEETCELKMKEYFKMLFVI